MNKKILLIAGDIGAGKDTIANKLVDHYTDYKAIKLAFANELKKIAHELYGIPLHLLYGSQADKEKSSGFPVPLEERLDNQSDIKYLSVREFVQRLSDNLKLLDLVCFCRPILSFIKSCQSYPGNCCGKQKNIDYFFISDFRFPFEYTFLKENLTDVDIKTVKLLRTGQTNTHNSETSLIGFEYDWYVEDIGINESVKYILNLMNTEL